MDSFFSVVGYGKKEEGGRDSCNVGMQISLLSDLQREEELCGGTFLYFPSGSFLRHFHEFEDSGIMLVPIHSKPFETIFKPNARFSTSVPHSF